MRISELKLSILNVRTGRQKFLKRQKIEKVIKLIKFCKNLKSAPRQVIYFSISIMSEKASYLSIQKIIVYFIRTRFFFVFIQNNFVKRICFEVKHIQIK